MYKFSIIISEDVEKKLRHLLKLAVDKKVTEENVVTLYIIYNNENITLNISSYIDAASGKVKIYGWGTCKDKSSIEKLSKDIGFNLILREKKPSLVDFSKMIINIYNRGVRDRNEIINEIIKSGEIRKEEVKKYLDLLKEAASRRVVREEVKKAHAILFG